MSQHKVSIVGVESCGKCKFGKPNVAATSDRPQHETRICVRFPPTISALMVHTTPNPAEPPGPNNIPRQQMAHNTACPIVGEDFWCGEYKKELILLQP